MLAPGKYEYSVIEPMIIQHVSGVLQIRFRSDMGPVFRIVTLVLYLLMITGSILIVTMYR
jgi:hypothetical protein